MLHQHDIHQSLIRSSLLTCVKNKKQNITNNLFVLVDINYIIYLQIHTHILHVNVSINLGESLKGESPFKHSFAYTSQN